VKSKVTVLPLTAAPALLVTLTVRILVCPDERDVGEPVNAAICCPEPVGEIIASPLLPHPLRQQNRAKQISSSNGRRKLALIDFTILLSFSLWTDDVFLGYVIFTRNIISFQPFFTPAAFADYPTSLRSWDSSTNASNFTSFVLPRRYAPGIIRPASFSTFCF
jgi:hypothetical protein